MGNNPISRLRKKHADRPRRKQDQEQSTNKSTAYQSTVDQPTNEQPNRVRGAAKTPSNPPPTVPSSRGIDPAESDDGPAVTLSRGTDVSTTASLSRGIDPPQGSLPRGN